ncbi:MAG TPA: ATP-binding protein [Verrucomicrobium sp.]|nr:ATP-binding protein [Verrucomicrobium sp.]
MSGKNRTPGDHQLSSIQIPDELKVQYQVLTGLGETEARGHNLQGLSRVNLFVGPNNTGKSRFLRGVAAAKELKFGPRLQAESIEESLNQLRSGKDRIEQQFQIFLERPIMPAIDHLGLDKCAEGEDITTSFVSFTSKWQNANSNDVSNRRQDDGRSLPPSSLLSEIQQVGISTQEDFKERFKSLSRNLQYHRLYLPTLRGLRPLPNPNQDVYADRVSKDYFTKDFKGEIFTGLKLYEELKALLLGDRQQRYKVRLYEDYLSKHLFGQKVSLIPRVSKDVVYVKIGNEEERPIYELGDGVQNVIILTFPLFSHADKPTLVFIEEPELFLHPGMQRTLLKAMMQFKDHQYFVSTHSNHLLDLAMEPEFDDVSIFKLHKETGNDLTAEDVTAKFTVELAVAHDHHLLEMLGTRVSSVFLSNCTIWVEGITDRRYFAHFLKLYSEHLDQKGEGDQMVDKFRPRQDYHFSFVEYSGGNVTHWSFLDQDGDAMDAQRLCARMMLIADQDESKGKKAERHKKLQDFLKDHFYLLEVREVENLLTPGVIRAVLEDYGEDLSAMNPFAQKDYKSKGLGEFIMAKLPTTVRDGGYKANSKTIKDKLGFCEKAISHMKKIKFEELSPEAQALTVKMYTFIHEQNHRRQ